MKCNLCGEIIKKEGKFNETLCIECEDKEILKALSNDR